MIRKFLYVILLPLMLLASCDDYETYAEKKESERDAINAYLHQINAKIISEDDLKSRLAADPTYSGEKDNEWVLLTKSSVYMQIVNVGTFYNKDGELLDMKIKPGQTKNIVCRFTETNIKTNTLSLTNLNYNTLAIPETMTVSRTSDTFTGSFIAGKSLMYSQYGSTSVPTGWLVPLTYLNIARNTERVENEIALVKLIVPHSQGHAVAASSVTPYMYEISYQEGK